MTQQKFVPAALLLGCCLLALAACGTPPPAQPPPVETATPITTPTGAPPTTPSPTYSNGDNGQARVSGTVVAESDVSGQPDVPLAGAAVIAMPIDAVATLAGAEPGSLSDRDLRFLSFTIERELAGMAMDVTGAEGRYELALPAGEYGLCLAFGEGGEAAPAGGPALPLIVRGCGRLSLAGGQVRSVDVSSGFGEILLEEQEGE
ncbi:MAG: hypothetical protein JXA93_24605 [Anaerolineae bacterium]|nr:hypothetical protein [Anaerolineae bacterium]